MFMAMREWTKWTTSGRMGARKTPGSGAEDAGDAVSPSTPKTVQVGRDMCLRGAKEISDSVRWCRLARQRALSIRHARLAHGVQTDGAERGLDSGGGGQRDGGSDDSPGAGDVWK